MLNYYLQKFHTARMNIGKGFSISVSRPRLIVHIVKCSLLPPLTLLIRLSRIERFPAAFAVGGSCGTDNPTRRTGT